MKKTSKILIGAGLAALGAGAIYGINRLVFYISTMKEILQSDKQAFYSWRFGNIYYTKEGTGSPVLLIHDASSFGSGYEWNKVIHLLAKKHTVYAIDLPGCGRSDKDTMIYTNYLYVQAVNDFVKSVIKKKTSIITSGQSSSIAMMACHSDPELFDKFIFINPESFKNMIRRPSAIEKAACYFMRLPLIGTALYEICVAKLLLKKKFEDEYFFDACNVDPDMIDAFYEAAHLGGSGARFTCASNIGCYTSMNIVHALKKIDHSMYMIGGAEVDGIEITFEDYQHFNPAIETILIPETKGMPHLENPDEVVNLCEIYLND